MHQAEGRLAWNQNELLPFFEDHVGRTQQRVFAVTVGDPAQRAHRAGNDCHCIRWIRAARKRSIHAFEPVSADAVGKPQAARQFLGNDRLSVIAQDNVHFVLQRVEAIQQALGIKHPTGSGDGDQ